MSANYYDILGVSKDASKGEISKAYKKLAGLHHPDRGGDPEKMKQINEAWDTLKDETKRNQYNNNGNSNDYSYQSRNQGGFSGSFSSHEAMNEFIRQHMYSSGWYSEPQQNEDVYIRVSVSLKDVYECKKQTIKYNFPGVGIEELSLEIPKGCYDGSKIKLPNKGSHQNKNFSRSDLIIMFKIDNPNNFDTNGHDILTIIKVNIIDIITGTTSVIDFIDGSKIEIKIPQSFGYQKRLRVKNKGLWRNGSLRGDLEVIVDYDIPKYNLTKEQLNMLKEIKNG